MHAVHGDVRCMHALHCWWTSAVCGSHVFFVQRYTSHITAARLTQLSTEADSSAEVSVVYWSALSVSNQN